MVFLAALVGALTVLVTHEAKNTAIQDEDFKMLYLAEAGVERALREIRDDYLTNTQTGTAYLRGSDTTGSVSVTNVDRIRYQEDGDAAINNNSDIAQLSTFDANYANTRIISVFLGARASRQNGGTGATIQVTYTTNGSFPQAGNTALTQSLTTTTTDYFQDITVDRSWTWATIMSSNFILRAQRTAGNRRIDLDTLFLRIAYGIDTATEPWSTGSYQTYPITLSSGTVQSVSIQAEQGKVHLTTTSQSLLRYLMVENGIADVTANSVATNIVNYRSSNPFDSIEELKQVSGVTTAIYDAIDQDITVYSFINSNAQGPAAARAPTNINTASQAVLRAIFDPITFDNASDITNLVNAIITQRNTAPFTCFYNWDSSVTTDFYDLVVSQPYLSNAEIDRVLGNADASALIPRSGGVTENAVTTEFSYDTNAFKIESVGRVNNRNLRIKTILGSQGNKTFTTFSGDTAAVGYRKENFES